MDWILAAIVGWCGTGWPIRFHGGSGSGVEPGDWPPNCPMCGRIIGALAGIVTVYALGAHFANAGMLGTVALAFFGGSFGCQVIGGIRGMLSKG